MITFTPLDPAWAVGCRLLLPERRPRLQIVHDEAAGIERGLAMGTGGADEDDGFTRFQRADPVQNLQLEQWPALYGFVGNFPERLFGHARRVLQKHPGHVPTIVEVAHVADEPGHRTDAQVGRMQRIEFGAGIEWRLLDANAHAQPPVTVGKKATSSPSAIGSSRPQSSWFRAHMRFCSASTSHALPLASSVRRRSSTV